MKTLFKRYVHLNKEDNFDLEKYFGNPDALYVGYEEELIYEYDSKIDKFTLVGADGRFLSNDKIDPSKLTRIEG